MFLLAVFILYDLFPPVWERAVHLVYFASIYVVSYNFPFGFEGRIWDLIVSVPDPCLSFSFLF